MKNSKPLILVIIGGSIALIIAACMIVYYVFVKPGSEINPPQAEYLGISADTLLVIKKYPPSKQSVPYLELTTLKSDSEVCSTSLTDNEAINNQIIYSKNNYLVFYWAPLSDSSTTRECYIAECNNVHSTCSQTERTTLENNDSQLLDDYLKIDFDDYFPPQ